MSQITTHILDTSIGKPAAGVLVRLFAQTVGNGWDIIAEGTTNEDGRIPGFIHADQRLAPGRYKIHFDTGSYFQSKKIATFYPYVAVVFELDTTQHHHVPLLLNPYGYSTYRGS
ncbi:MAG: hydroxyisourate hydrolase [Bacteroidota bacterium]